MVQLKNTHGSSATIVSQRRAINKAIKTHCPYNPKHKAVISSATTGTCYDGCGMFLLSEVKA